MPVFPGKITIFSVDGEFELMPSPIVAERAPGASDFAEVGQQWVDVTTDSAYQLTSVVNGVPTWSTSPASGVGSFTSLTVNPGNAVITAGDLTVSAGDFALTLGNATIGGNLTVAGTTTLNGDVDINTSALFDITSSLDADPAILFDVNGGTSSVLRLLNQTGTAVDSIDIQSDVGGITLNSGLASDDAINLSAGSGGIDVDAAMQINIASSENTADAIVINASAGGLDILAAGAAGEDIDIVNTAGSININSGEVIANSMVLTSAGGLDFTVAGTGGLDIDMVNSAGSVNIEGGEAAGDAIVLHASDAAGGVQIQAGSAGILIGNQADCAVIDVGDIVPTATRLISVGGGAVATAISDTIDIGPDGATTDAGASKVVNINTGALDTATLTTNIGSGNRASGTHATNVSTGTGTKTVSLGNADGLTTFNVDAITLINDSINVDTSINTGTSSGSVLVGNAAATAVNIDALTFSVDATTASNVTVTGAADLDLISTAGSINLTGGEADQDAVFIEAGNAGGGVRIRAGSLGILVGDEADTAVISLGDVVPTSARTITVGGGAVATAIADTIDIGADGATTDAGASKVVNIASGALDTATQTVNIASGNVASGTQAVNVLTGTGTKSASLGNADGLTTFNVDAITLINDSINVNTSINTGTSTGTVAIGNSAATAVNVDALTFSIDSTTASNVTVTGASADLTLAATGGSVNITATEAAADAIALTASNAAGGIDLVTGGGEISISSSGNVSMAPGTASVAGNSLTINARVGVATFTGLTTAAGANEDFTITNSALGAGDGVFVTVSNLGSNDADMTLEGVITQTAGTLTIHTQNNGSAALNGDVVISFWIIN